MKKIGRGCAGCRQPIRSRYRALVDEYLCDPCYTGWFTKRTEQRATVEPSEPEPPPLPPPSAAHEEIAMFDLSHLVPK